jgi:hypothetical protein
MEEGARRNSPSNRHRHRLPQPKKNFETIDYVRELFLNSEEQKKTDHKRVRLSPRLGDSAFRYRVLHCCGNGGSRANRAHHRKGSQRFSRVVQKIDVDALVTTVNDFTDEAGNTFTSVGNAVSCWKSWISIAHNETIAQLKTAVDLSRRWT